MTTFWAAVVALLVIGFLIAGLHRHATSNWLFLRAWRWLSGEAHHGDPITDAGWFRPGQKALTRTGHAHAWWHLPRWKRAAHRTGSTLAVFGVIFGWMTAPLLTIVAVCAATAAGLILAGMKIRLLILAWADRRTWLHPLHLAAHELAGHPKAVPARSWISIEAGPDGGIHKAMLALPPGWPADTKDKERLVSIASQKLGIEAAEPAWRLAGPAPLLTLTQSPPPPDKVRMDELLPELLKCKPDEMLIGVGKNESLITASLATDSPHIALSMGTGAGKSNLAGWLLLQMLLRGSIGLVLDAKRRLSYPWILKDEHGALMPLPNVAYAWTTAQLHSCMTWMSSELDRRGDVAFTGMDATGQVHANVGPRLFTLAEELNLAVPRLRAYWQEQRSSSDPAKSPAFTGLGEVAFAGRQVRKHLVLIGQMLTAEATGSRDSSVKENCGIKLLARYGPKGWRIMAEDIPMPPPPTVTGRVQVVTSGAAREAQVPLLDGVHARQLVLASDMALLPAGMPCAPAVETVSPQLTLDTQSDQHVETVSASSCPEFVTLQEAVDAGILHPGTNVKSLRNARHRDPDGFPKRRGVRKSEYVYDPADLAAYDAARRT